MSEEEASQSMTPDEIVAKLDTSFLSTGRFKKLKESLDDLKTNYEKHVRKFLDENEKFVEEILEDGTFEEFEQRMKVSFQTSLKRKRLIKSEEGKMYILAASKPFDYKAHWYRQQKKQYEDAEKAGDNALIDELVKKHIVDKSGEPLDSRRTFSSGNENPNWKTRLRDKTAFISNVYGLFVPNEGGKALPFLTLLGGEMAPDTIINPTCPKCGKTSWTKICRNEDMDRRGNVVICGHVRADYMFEDIVSNIGTAIETNMKVENGEVTWTRNTIPMNGKELSFKEKRNLMKKLIPDAIKANNKVFEATDFVKGTGLVQYWKRNKDKRGKLAIYTCSVFEIYDRPNSIGEITLLCDDPSLAMDSEDENEVTSIRVNVPEHIWQLYAKDRVTTGSEIVVIGEVSRRKASEKRGNQWVQLETWRYPEIRAQGIVVLTGEKPKEIKNDLVVEQNKIISSATSTDLKDIFIGKSAELDDDDDEFSSSQDLAAVFSDEEDSISEDEGENTETEDVDGEEDEDDWEI